MKRSVSSRNARKHEGSVRNTVSGKRNTSDIIKKPIKFIVLPVLKLSKHYAMKTYGGGGVDVYIHIFLTSALVGGEWSGSRPGRFTAEERGAATSWLGGWVDPRAGLDDMEK
jgi:hypothetical protein